MSSLSNIQKLFIYISLISCFTCLWKLWTIYNNGKLTFYESISIQNLPSHSSSGDEINNQTVTEPGVTLIAPASTNSQIITQPQRIKKILYATRSIFYSNPNKKSCGACTFTSNLKEWNNSDAIIFHGGQLDKVPKEYLQWKGSNQVWIYYLQEPATGISRRGAAILNSEPYKSKFNWTVSFRRDSDIYSPYYQIKRDENAKKFDPEKILKSLKNKKMIAWIVSNCFPVNKRDVLAKELSKYVAVDIYGRCGTQRCALDRSQSSGHECRQELSKQYKFYLAFENAYCEDYITEKFYQTFNTEMVPIVYGANYTYVKNLPETSYINVEDYKLKSWQII